MRRASKVIRCKSAAIERRLTEMDRREPGVRDWSGSGSFRAGFGGGKGGMHEGGGVGEGGSGTRQPLDQSGGISSKSSERRTPCQTATSDLSTPSTSSSPVAVRPQRPYGLLGTVRGAQDFHLDFHSAPELCFSCFVVVVVVCCPTICADLHCSRAARPGIPHIRPHPGLIPHRGPIPRGPQEVTSDRWWAAIRRRHCTAAESVRWC